MDYEDGSMTDEEEHQMAAASEAAVANAMDSGWYDARHRQVDRARYRSDEWYAEGVDMFSNEGIVQCDCH